MAGEEGAWVWARVTCEVRPSVAAAIRTVEEEFPLKAGDLLSVGLQAALKRIAAGEYGDRLGTDAAERAARIRRELGQAMLAEGPTWSGTCRLDAAPNRSGDA